MRIRPERPSDYPAVYEINRAAFEGDGEPRLVDAHRSQARDVISLVAEDDGAIVGHILYSPVTLSGHEQLRIAGLAPMAVLPGRQRSGIGSALVRAGLDACRQQGCVAVVVVGHPEYYPRFGFRRGSALGIDCEFEVPDEAFMAVELTDGALRGRGGTISYHEAFRNILDS
jgi:putative acetyltransferase